MRGERASALNPGQFSNSTVSPNQFAFQGLDTPHSALVRKGYSFKLTREQGTHRSAFGDKLPTDSYVMEAFHESDPRRTVADLEWLGPNHTRGLSVGGDYPGHIEYVSTSDAHQRQGLATTLYQHATHTDMGQKTRPVHSPVLTEDGKRFRNKVGGPGYVNKPGGGGSGAPEGYHPFEAEQEEPVAARRAKAAFHDRRLRRSGGQLRLPGME